MSEVRDGMPYVSRLKYTIRNTSKLDFVRELEDGRSVYQRGVDLPGLLITVTPYLASGLQAADSSYEFKSKAFWEAQLAGLQAIEAPTTQDTRAIQLVENLLATNKLWLEDVLMAAGIADLESAWGQAFSDSLDGFPQWAEPAQRLGGLPIRISQLQWDVKIPWEGLRQVEVKMGIFRKADFSDEPKQTSLVFEDGESKRARQRQVDDMTAAISRTNADIVGIERVIELLAASPTPESQAELATFNQQIVNNPDLPAYLASVKSDRDNRIRVRDELANKTFGDLATLIAHPSAGSTTMGLVMGAFSVLKVEDEDWTDVDLAVLQAAFALPDLT